MGLTELLGLTASILLVATVGAVAVSRERSSTMQRLLVLGLVLRVAGSLAYFGILETVYGGGDYQRYLREATAVVESEADPGRSNISIVARYGGRWWGTPSIAILSSWIMKVFGTGPLAVFVVFGTISFLAVLCFVYAFRHVFPEINPATYTAWLMLFPSLWFWPSPVGKDGPVLLGIGLAFLGVMGLRGQRNYVIAAVGIAITIAVRPQYALVFLAAVLGGLLLGRQATGGSVAKFMAVVLLVAGAAYVATVSSDLLGFEVTEAEETADWIDRRGEATAYGGSAFVAASNPLTGLFNSLFRPLPWEARGVLVLLSSMEIVILWVLLYRRRQAITVFVQRYRRTEAFWISLLLVLALAAAVGMSVGNFGTLVRQRIHLYPFLFLITASMPIRKVSRTRRISQRLPGVAPPIPA